MLMLDELAKIMAAPIKRRNALRLAAKVLTGGVPYDASCKTTEMPGFAQVLADAIRARVQHGQNIYDQAAATLKPGLQGRRGYPDNGKRPPAIRDWIWSGHTLRCLKVLTANENHATSDGLNLSSCIRGQPQHFASNGFTNRADPDGKTPTPTFR